MRPIPQALFTAASTAGPLGLVLAATYAIVHELAGFELSDVTLMITFAAIMAVQMWVQSVLKAKGILPPGAGSTDDPK